MNNIVTYAERTFDPFEELPLSDVDSLILSWLSYIRYPVSAFPKIAGWDGMLLKDLFCAEHFSEMFYGIWDMESSKRLLTALVASPRFRDLRLCGYQESVDPDEEKQFAAVTIVFEDGSAYLSFRGTDASFVGWKEDFNMAFQCPIPSQKSAAAYLEEVSSRFKGPLYLGGHSKGGNLAVYAALKADAAIQDRILAVFSHDGPGFQEEILQSVAFEKIQHKIHKTVPQFSVIGMLLEQQEEFRIVKSNRVSLWQHDPFSWMIDGKDFDFLEDLKTGAKYIDKTLNEWVRSITPQERKNFIDSVYFVLASTSVSNFSEFRSDWQQNTKAMVQAATQMSDETKACIANTLKALAAQGVKNIPEVFLNL